MSLQTEIINELGVKPTIDPKEEIRKSIDFMKAYLKNIRFLKTFVLRYQRRPRFYFSRPFGATNDGRNA